MSRIQLGLMYQNGEGLLADLKRRALMTATASGTTKLAAIAD
ncbi:MAG: hypothetical protein Q8J67_01825 [Rhodocyclaceae bacterium]|nr:hypothetical protein [Rhodocyclaceae bacterium]MDP3037017.1 hypothetical protein [Rhodocyclaceae bacterium]